MKHINSANRTVSRQNVTMYCNTQSSLLTKAHAGTVEELKGPPLAVVDVLQVVGPPPRLVRHPQVAAHAAARHHATDVGWVGAKRGAALFGEDALHRAAGSGELGPRPVGPPPEAEQKQHH